MESNQFITRIVMNKAKQHAGLKTTIVLLSLVVVGSVFYNVKAANDSQILTSTAIQTTTEKDKVLQRLDHLKAIYDAVINQKSALSNELIMQREKVIALIADLNKSNNTATSVQNLKNRYFALETKMKSLLAENNKLKLLNETLSIERDSMQSANSVALKSNGSLVVQNGKLSKSITKEQSLSLINLKNFEAVNEETVNSNQALATLNLQLSKTVAKAQKLSILNLKSTAELQKSSGKKVDTEKASRTNFLKISFTIAENAMAMAGSITHNIQVLDPDNNVLGEKKIENYGNKRLTYSWTSTVQYENKAIDVTEEFEVNDLLTGTYYVNVFNKGELVSKTSFSLK